MRFDELNLGDAVLDGLEAMNFQEMTPIQELSTGCRQCGYYGTYP